MRIYQVGGAVRDRLLGREVSDRDWVVVGATAEQLLTLGYRQVGADFPVFLHPDSHEEYALARTERKSGHGYKGFVTDAASTVTLEEDLARRDFTINAMAMGEDGVLVDPYGGQRDLAAGVLRHVTAAFVEDPLRVLRAARFAARFGFVIADETQALMRALVDAGELATLAPERVWQELRRALAEHHPARFIEVLRECGALAALLPEVDALFGVPQPARHHPEIDTGVHILMALQQAVRRNADELVRFAVLTHDLGKGTTPADILPRHIAHEERSIPLVKQLCERIAAPRDYRDLALIVAQWHTHCHRALELRPGTILSLLQGTDAFRRPERFNQFLLCCEADARGRTGFEERDYPQANYLRDALAQCQQIDMKAISAGGFTGKAFGDEVDRQRLTLLTEHKANQAASNTQ